MPSHDLLVYDDDSRQLHLKIRIQLVEDALAAVQSDQTTDTFENAKVEGYSSRDALLSAIANRNPSDWAVAFIDLEDRDGSMRGGRMIRTIREHHELMCRCMPTAMTIYTNPVMQLDLQPWSFAIVGVAAPDSPQRLADALRAMADRHPTEPTPRCDAFPEIEPKETWDRGIAEAFYRFFKTNMRRGDDIVIRHLARDVPNEVTNRRLAVLPNRDANARRDLNHFNKEIEYYNQGWNSQVVKEEVKRFVDEMRYRGLRDPLDPSRVATAADAWRDRRVRDRAWVPSRSAPAVSDFFDSFESERRRLGRASNRQADEEAFHQARAHATSRHPDVPSDYYEHIVHVLLDILRADQEQALHGAPPD